MRLIKAIFRFMNPHHDWAYISHGPCRTTFTDKHVRQANYIRRLERQG